MICLNNLQSLIDYSVNSTNGFAILISIAAILIIYIMKIKSSNAFVNNFAVLTAVIISLVASILFAYEGPIVGHIDQGLPALTIPSFENIKISATRILFWEQSPGTWCRTVPIE